MGYVGKNTEDMLIQKAYGELRKRGYTLPLSSCYYSLLGTLQRDGEGALEEYVKQIGIKSKAIYFEQAH